MEKKLKIKKGKLPFCSKEWILFVFLIPSILLFDNKYSLIYKVWHYAQIFCSCYLIYRYFLRKKNIQKIALFTGLYGLFSIISCCVNSISPIGSMFDALTILGVVVLILMYYKKDNESFISVFTIIVSTYLIINFLTILLFPNGIVTGRIGQPIWFLGDKNVIIPYILLDCILLIEKKRIKGEPLNRKDYLIIGLICGSGLIVESATGTALVILAFVVIMIGLIFNLRKNGFHFSGKMFLVLIIVSFVIVVFSSSYSSYTHIITNALGRDISFSGRIFIWDIAIGYIKQSPLFGKGPAIEFFPYGFSVPMTHTHDIYLDIAAKYGLLSLGTILFMIVKIFAAYKGKQLLSNQFHFLLYYFFSLFLLGAIFEVYNYSFIFIIMTILYAGIQDTLSSKMHK